MKFNPPKSRRLYCLRARSVPNARQTLLWSTMITGLPTTGEADVSREVELGSMTSGVTSMNVIPTTSILVQSRVKDGPLDLPCHDPASIARLIRSSHHMRGCSPWLQLPSVYSRQLSDRCFIIRSHLVIVSVQIEEERHVYYGAGIVFPSSRARDQLRGVTYPTVLVRRW